jgi:hypothetical protein
MKRIGFTGGRNGLTINQRVALRDMLVPYSGYEFHHGDCVGSDAQAHGYAMRRGMRVILHPPNSAVLRAFCQGHGRASPSHT